MDLLEKRVKGEFVKINRTNLLNDEWHADIVEEESLHWKRTKTKVAEWNVVASFRKSAKQEFGGVSV